MRRLVRFVWEDGVSASGEVFFKFFFLPRSCVCLRVRDDLKVILAVLHDEVGDSKNGRIRYVLPFFFPRFLASSDVLCCAPCPCPLISTGNTTMQRLAHWT